MSDKIGDIRPSQLIGTFGPGAVMDLPDLSIIIAGTDSWDLKQCRRIDEPRVMKKLQISKIYTPPTMDSNEETHQGTLPARRFPDYLVCPSCRKLAPAIEFHINEKGVAKCYCDGQPRVFPARFIMACQHGHIDDLPWLFYVHDKAHKDCSGDLFLYDRGVTGSIDDVQVKCKKCGNERTLSDAFSKKVNHIGRCTGNRPWLANHENCDQVPRAYLRGASNLYFPMVVSSIKIPPFTSAVHEAVSSVSDRLQKIQTIDQLKTGLDLGFLDELKEFPLDIVWKAIQEQSDLGSGENVDLLHPEWSALIEGNDTDSFQTEPAEVPHRFKPWISKLVKVRRLTEVRVLNGFTRIEPIPDRTSMLTPDDETYQAAHIAPISSVPNSKWKPGIETHGEGIFITLNEAKLQEWEAQFTQIPMGRAFEKYCEERKRPGMFPGARYALIHTLSHALMRQLCLYSGYSSTALRERIYARNNAATSMAGVLIYTATPDSEGSLGGLVELGESGRFEEILWQALNDALYCSGDPLCSEHKPDALGDINGAACHACMLAAETSCETSNMFLDRTFLVPTVSERDLAYFRDPS